MFRTSQKCSDSETASKLFPKPRRFTTLAGLFHTILAVLRSLVVHGLLRQTRLEDVEFAVDVLVHLEHLLVLVRVRIAKRDVALELRDLLRLLQLVPVYGVVLAARALTRTKKSETAAVQQPQRRTDDARRKAGVR